MDAEQARQITKKALQEEEKFKLEMLDNTRTLISNSIKGEAEKGKFELITTFHIDPVIRKELEKDDFVLVQEEGKIRISWK